MIGTHHRCSTVFQIRFWNFRSAYIWKKFVLNNDINLRLFDLRISAEDRGSVLTVGVLLSLAYQWRFY